MSETTPNRPITPILDRVKIPADIKRLSDSELRRLADDANLDPDFAEKFLNFKIGRAHV